MAPSGMLANHSSLRSRELCGPWKGLLTTAPFSAQRRLTQSQLEAFGSPKQGWQAPAWSESVDESPFSPNPKVTGSKQPLPTSGARGFLALGSDRARRRRTTLFLRGPWRWTPSPKRCTWRRAVFLGVFPAAGEKKGIWILPRGRESPSV